jgi:hypothetical protein
MPCSRRIKKRNERGGRKTSRTAIKEAEDAKELAERNAKAATDLARLREEQGAEPHATRRSRRLEIGLTNWLMLQLTRRAMTRLTKHREIRGSA